MMSVRPLAEAKNTVEHNIAAQERAHSVHMKITLFVLRSLKEFHDQLLSYGAPPVALLRHMMLREPGDLDRPCSSDQLRPERVFA